MPTIPGQRFAGKHDNLPVKDGSPQVPIEFQDDEDKINLFNLVVTDLTKRGLWGSTYLIPTMELVETAVRLKRCREALDEEGDTIETIDNKGRKTGMFKSNPRFDQAIKLQTQLLKLIEKFGMTPKDIVFLTQTDPSTATVIEATAVDPKAPVYWSD